MIHALIDGDWILYAAGFAGQKQKLVLPATFGAREFANITEIKAALHEEYERELDENDFVYKRDVLDPPSHFFHSAKNMINRNLQKIGEKFGEEQVTYTVLMDGDGNFRSRLATMRPYKGNRSSHSKPLFYNDLRQYLLDAWDAEVVHGQETDDEMAIRQTGNKNSIIVAVDKDMLQVPGWHLNPNKGFKKISKQEGDWRLYVQCLTGDTVDNIPGAYKIGPAAAKKLVTPKMSVEEMWDAVLHGYDTSMDAYPDKYPEGMMPEDAATENMRLVYLRREPGEIWMPPEV
jgi:hypothetical protein